MIFRKKWDRRKGEERGRGG
jgi:hypothetical protein